MRKLIDWCDAHSGFVEAVSVFMALSFGVFAIWQTSTNTQITQDALYLSATPTLQVDVQSEKVVITNPGLKELYEIQINLVLYHITNNPTGLQARTVPAGDFFSTNKLAPGAKIELSEQQLDAQPLLNPVRKWEGFPVRALIITFRRSIDRKQYLHFEPLNGVSGGLFPIYHHKLIATSGPWHHLLDFIPELEKKERLMFGTARGVGE